MLPAVGISKPAVRRSRVVLPQPDGPSSVKNSFCRIVTETLSNATTASGPAPNVLVTFLASTAGIPVKIHLSLTASRDAAQPCLLRFLLFFSLYGNIVSGQSTNCFINNRHGLAVGINA